MRMVYSEALIKNQALDLLEQHHKVAIRQEPETYIGCDLCMDSERLLHEAGRSRMIPKDLQDNFPL